MLLTSAPWAVSPTCTARLHTVRPVLSFTPSLLLILTRPLLSQGDIDGREGGAGAGLQIRLRVCGSGWRAGGVRVLLSSCPPVLLSALSAGLQLDALGLRSKGSFKC